jgi:hypothetical protein
MSIKFETLVRVVNAARDPADVTWQAVQEGLLDLQMRLQRLEGSTTAQSLDQLKQFRSGSGQSETGNR